MRAVVFLAAFWLMPFLFFGWRTWPSKQERERQREVSKLYDCHFAADASQVLPGVLVAPRRRKTSPAAARIKRSPVAGLGWHDRLGLRLPHWRRLRNPRADQDLDLPDVAR
jgi:hypothetical protein